MSRWLAPILLAGVVLASSSARAQAAIELASLRVDLWPEYDQPSMLVIYDLELAPGTELPVSLPIRFPREANLVAVARHGDGQTLLNAEYQEAAGDEEWQSIVLQIQAPARYRIEYFQPLSRDGDRRSFSYVWPGDYAIRDLSLSVRMPSDATAVSVDPELQRGSDDGATYYLESSIGALAAGNTSTLALEYARNSEALVAPPQGLQPSQPVDSSTPGRVMLSNYMPYILGLLGVGLIAGGSLYFWQSSRGRPGREKRHRKSAHADSLDLDNVYCHQCGARAHLGDRFCRVCGSRLRPPT